MSLLPLPALWAAIYPELLVEICKYLKSCHLMALCCSCKAFRQHLADNGLHIWLHLSSALRRKIELRYAWTLPLDDSTSPLRKIKTMRELTIRQKRLETNWSGSVALNLFSSKVAVHSHATLSVPPETFLEAQLLPNSRWLLSRSNGAVYVFDLDKPALVATIGAHDGLTVSKYHFFYQNHSDTVHLVVDTSIDKRNRPDGVLRFYTISLANSIAVTYTGATSFNFTGNLYVVAVSLTYTTYVLRETRPAGGEALMAAYLIAHSQPLEIYKKYTLEAFPKAGGCLSVVFHSLPERHWQYPPTDQLHGRHDNVKLHFMFDSILLFFTVNGIVIYNLGLHSNDRVQPEWEHSFGNHYHPVYPPSPPQLLTCTQSAQRACIVGNMVPTMPDYSLLCFQLVLVVTNLPVLEVHFSNNVPHDFAVRVGLLHERSNWTGPRPNSDPTRQDCRFHFCQRHLYDHNLRTRCVCVAADVVNGRILEYWQEDCCIGELTIQDI